MQVKWIKLCTDIFDDEKIILIESMPDCYAIITVWFKLLCLAGKQNNCGVFMMNERIPYTEKMLATIFRMNEATVKMAFDIFERFQMITVIDGVITIPNWNKHQNLDAYEKKKERDRLYQAERRANQKALIEKSSDKSSDIVVSEEDKEEGKEKEQEIIDNTPSEEPKTPSKPKKAKQKASAFAHLLEGYDDEVRNLLLDWLDVRKNKRAAATEHAITLNLDKLEDMAKESKMSVSKYLEEVIRRGWATFYPIRSYGNSNPEPKETPKASYNLGKFEESSLYSELKYERKKR